MAHLTQLDDDTPAVREGGAQETFNLDEGAIESDFQRIWTRLQNEGESLSLVDSQAFELSELETSDVLAESGTRGRPPHYAGPLERKRLVTLTSAMDEQLKQRNRQTGIPVLEIIRRIIEQHLDGLLPVVGSIRCGVPEAPITDSDEHLTSTDVTCAQPGDVWTRVHGDSMAPEIIPGDIALMRLKPPLRQGAVCAVQIYEERGMQGEVQDTLKRVYRPDRKTVILKAANPHYPPMTLHADRVQIIGHIITVTRKYN